MKCRRNLGHVTAAIALLAFNYWLAVPALATEAKVFEQSVLKSRLGEDEKLYYAAIWTSLGFFRGTDEARAMLAPFDIVTQRREVDSIASVLFLPLDSDPITPGNSFLGGLAEKIGYAEHRGFVHTPGAFLTECFDDIGVLVLLNGVPLTTLVVLEDTDICPICKVETYLVAWGGEDYIFQKDGWGYWRMISTEGLDTRFPGGAPVVRSFVMQRFNEQLIGGVAVFDPDLPLDEHSVLAKPVALRDTSDWESGWVVMNVGLRTKDFTRDSSGWKRIRVRGTLAVLPAGDTSPVLFDSTEMDVDLGREKPGRDDLVVQQRVKKVPRGDGERRIRGYVLGVDLVNSKDRHWKKSIPFPIGWSDDSVTVAYGWLLNAQVVDPACLGGRPPLLHDVIQQGDSLFLFFQLTDAGADLTGRFRTHIRLRFIRQETRAEEVTFSRLYRLGTEPLTRGGDAEVSAATVLGMVETASANSNVTFGTMVPKVAKGTYKIVAECHRSVGVDPRPFELVIFDNIRIRQAPAQAAK